MTPVVAEGVGVPDGEVDGEVELDGEVEADAEPEGDGLPDGLLLVEGDGLGEPDAGQVWVRLKKSAVPVITAVAPVNVQPAGVTIQAFEVCGPPLSKLPGLAALVIVTLPFAPKLAVTDTKSPLTLCWPGRTNTQTSWPANGPPPWFASHS